MTTVIHERDTFSSRLMSLLSRTAYRKISNPSELEQVYRLRYEANLREGTIEAKSEARLYDRFDETDNVLNIGVYIDDHLAAALRLHVLSQADKVSPALDAYPDLIEPLLKAGATLIDTSRLAANFPFARNFPHLPYVTLRLGVMAAEHFNANFITGACRAEHFPFYAREYMGVRACPPRPYPTLIKPLCLVLIDYRAHRTSILERRPFYGSTFEQRERLFADSLTLA